MHAYTQRDRYIFTNLGAMRRDILPLQSILLNFDFSQEACILQSQGEKKRV